MKKIMFNKYLTEAVKEGRKNKTRRTVSRKTLNGANEYVQRIHGTGLDFLDYLLEHSRYKVGEIVAVAQSYKDVMEERGECGVSPLVAKAGYLNKMFVRSEHMPHKIRITSFCIERIQDICDEDCIMEGVFLDETAPLCYRPFYIFPGSIDHDTPVGYETPREAFAALIKKMAGKKAWDDNPWVFVYEFELVK